MQNEKTIEKVGNWKRNNKTLVIIGENGEIEKDQVIYDNETVEIKKSLTARQLEAYQKKLEKKQNLKLLKIHISRNEGSYFHLIYKYGIPLLHELQAKYEGNKSNIHIVRFIQLATYVTSNGNLFDENRNRIKRSSLSKIWDTTSKNSIKETYEALKECGYIFETKEGYIMINEEIVIKGVLDDFKKLREQDSNLTCTRLFTENIQAMYEGTEPKKRKQLANLFKALPFINFKYNVFCLNPTETDDTKLKLLKWTDLARLCGYEEKKNIKKFQDDLWNLKVDGYDTIGEFKTQSGMAICINPKVFYSGDNIDDVRNLYAMFSMLQSKN